MKKQHGVTLLELIVTITIASIVLTMAGPSLMALIKNNRLVASTNAFVSSMYLARSEAVKRGTRVTLCKSADGASCASSGAWEQGWIVFVDGNENATYEASEDTLLRVEESRGAGVTMEGGNGIDTYISYIAGGRAQRTDGTFQAGTITICDDRTGNYGKSIILNSTGRVRTVGSVACE